MSAELVVITPSRARPERFAQMVTAVRDTTDGRVSVFGCLDRADPQFAQYAAIDVGSPSLIVHAGRWRPLSEWANFAADLLLRVQALPPRYLAFFGDDHVPRTPDWDLKLCGAAESVVGWAYGDDGYQHAKLPTAWVVCASVVRAIGWMMLPDLEHMYVDNAVLELGARAGRIAYCPNVSIEHMHPLAGKAASDAGYEQVNNAAQYERDRKAFTAWRENIGGGFERDVNRLIGVHSNE